MGKCLFIVSHTAHFEKQPPDVLMVPDSRQCGYYPQTAPHQPSWQFHGRHNSFYSVLIWRTIQLQVGIVVMPPPACTAAFQFHIRPITQLSLLKSVPP